MSLYVDTSCLLKLFFPEPESADVATRIAREQRVIVSTLAKLEAVVQIQGRWEGGFLTRRGATSLVQRLDKTTASAPFEVMRAPLDLAEVALDQILPLGKGHHCRTADRLHLAIMERLGVSRLLTNDSVQAAAARQKGLQVIMPAR